MTASGGDPRLREGAIYLRNGEPIMHMPKQADPQAVYPPHLALLAAVWFRWTKDPEWRREMIRWLKQDMRTRS